MNTEDIDLGFGILFVLFLGLLGAGILSWTKHHQSSLRFQLRLFLIALAVRFAASLAIYQFGLVNILKDEDGSGWVTGAILMKQWVRADASILDLPALMAHSFQEHHKGYRYLLAGVFFLTDAPARLPAAVLNCFFGALTVMLVYRSARSLFSEWVAVRSGWFVCFFPSLIIWSAQTVKEPVVILLETLALYCCVRLHVAGFKLRYLMICGGAIVLLIPFRFYAAWIAGAAVMMTLLLPHLGRRKFSIGTAIVLASLVIPLVVMSGSLLQQESELERFDLTRIQNFKRDVATGGREAGSGSGVIQNYDLRTPSGMTMALSVGAAHLLLAPFPWQLGGGSLRMLLSTPELLAWWYLFAVAIVPGSVYLFRHRFSDIQPLLYFIVGLGGLYSVMFGNVGLVFRQRAQLLPWLLIIAAVGLERRWLEQRVRRQRFVKREALWNLHSPVNTGASQSR